MLDLKVFVGERLAVTVDLPGEVGLRQRDAVAHLLGGNHGTADAIKH